MSDIKLLIMGPVCSGKTWSTRTLLAEYPDQEGKIHRGAGKEVFTVSLEPGWQDTMGDCTCDMGMHLHYIPPLDVDWETLMQLAEAVNRAGDVTKVVDPNKRDYTQFLDTYKALSNYECQRCGKNFGSASKFGPDKAVVMDGLTGLSRNAMNWTTGLKPSKSWPEFDAAGQQVENLLRKCVSLACTFVLIAHMDREPDLINGGKRLMMHTIGNKLAPRLTKDLFSEIAYAYRDDRGRFYWSTIEGDMDLKARRLPFKANIEPDFATVLAV